MRPAPRRHVRRETTAPSPASRWRRPLALLATVLLAGAAWLAAPALADRADGIRGKARPGVVGSGVSIAPGDPAPAPGGAAEAPTAEEPPMPIPGLADDATPQQIFETAERLRAEQSFALAAAAYTRLLQHPAGAGELQFPALYGQADAQWRAGADFEQLRKIGRVLDRIWQDVGPREELAARAAESLGDLRAQNPYLSEEQDISQDPTRVQFVIGPWLLALAYHADAPQSPETTAHYVALCFKIAQACFERDNEPPFRPLAIAATLPALKLPAQDDPAAIARWALRSVLAATKDKEAVTRAHLMLGQLAVREYSQVQWRVPQQEQQQAARERLAGEVDEQFTAAAQAGGSEASMALFEHAQFLSGNRADYVAAVAKLREALAASKATPQPWTEAAENMLDQITAPQATLFVPQAFTPDSHLRLELQTRNLKDARLIIERIEPATLVAARKGELAPAADASDRDKPFPGTTVYSEPTVGLVDDGKHTPQSKPIFLDPLPAGVYQVRLEAPAIKDDRFRPSPTLTFVTQLAAATRVETTKDGEKLHVFTTDAESGRVAAETKLTLLVTTDREQRNWSVIPGATNAEGLAQLALPPPPSDSNRQTWLLAQRGNEAIMLQGWGGHGHGNPADEGNPTLVAWSDRPAYRPGDTVQFKGLLRMSNGKAWSLPKLNEVLVTIQDQRGATLHEATLPLSANGTFHGAFTPGRSAALGMLQLQVLRAGSKDILGNAELARLEEYKLPEYKVGVEPAAGPHRLGEAVPFTINAEYYAGGPVAGADVEVIIHRQAFAQSWWPPYPWPWFSMDGGGGISPRALGRGDRIGWWPSYQPETLLARHTLKTDAQGRAIVTLDAESSETLKKLTEDGLWGYTYRIEARVVDLSRREVIGEGQIKLARTAFAAYLTPQRNLVLPADPLRTDLKLLDPNDRPVAAEGTAKLYRRTWNPDKPVLDANGKPTGQLGDYDDALLDTKPAGSGSDGNGVIEFAPGKEGVYRITFTARDAYGQEVTAEATTFVAASTTTDVGLRAGGLTLVTDKQRYKRGETAQVMVVSRRPGVAVWFAAEAEALHSQRVIQLAPGATTQAFALPITEEYEPNIFLTALAMFDASVFQESAAIAVPPVDRVLDVKLTPSKTDYRPGERATIDLEVRDEAGKPVATELSLAVADDAVWAIQSELTPDLRAFFWGRSRSLQQQLQATPQHFAIQRWRPIPGKPGEYEIVGRDEAEADQNARKELRELGGDSLNDFMDVRSGVMPKGGVVRLAAAAPAADALAEPASFGEPGPLEFQQARLRSDFSATALWLPMLTTDGDGRARAEFTLPDSLTTWRATARAADATTRVGEARETLKTNQQVMLRPQHPRFLVEGDEAVLSAIIDNRATQSLAAQASLGLAGGVKFGAGAQSTQSLTIDGASQRRIEWLVTADAPGSAALTMQVLTPLESDAALKKIPILEYGTEQFLTAAGTIGTTDTAGLLELSLTMPEAIKPGSESLIVWLEPTLARSMVNALPYLAKYPYGCVEQTTSRFVPAVITLKTLQQLGLRRPELEAEVPKMIEAGLERLAGMQRPDGAWGWWPGGSADPWMTAYVIASLAEARTADVQVDAALLRPAALWLAANLHTHRDDPAMAAFMLHALGRARDLVQDDAGALKAIDTAHAAVWAQRSKLTPYGRALFALATHLEGRTSETAVLARNLYDGIVWDRANGTAHWGSTGIYYHWSEGGIEATAYGLRALLAIDPHHALVEPVTQWLVRNRKGARWESTRDTAIVIGALADVIKLRGEVAPRWTTTVQVNGQDAGQLSVEPATALDGSGRIEIPRALLRPGVNTIRIARDGAGAVYASAWLKYFTREEKIAAAMNEVGVTRRYFLVGEEQTASGQLKPTRRELKPGEPLQSGQRVEVELTLDAKNHYEYVMLEDPKAAGLEPVEVQSGHAWLPGLFVYRELRDEKAAFFIDRLPQGKHVLTYTLRAETTGLFHALPAQAQAMYVPEIRGNSTNERLRVTEAAPQ